MKTVYEIAEEYRLPVKKLEMLVRDKLLAARIPEKTASDAILVTLKKGNALSVDQLRTLIKKPETLADLGDYDWLAKRQIERLGDVAGEALPFDQFPHVLIDGAGRKDDESLARFSAWIASIIPEGGCSYQYVGVRAALNISDVQFPVVYPVLAKAIRNARKHENLAGMSSIIDRATVFHREKSFDL